MIRVTVSQECPLELVLRFGKKVESVIFEVDLAYSRPTSNPMLICLVKKYWIPALGVRNHE
jgi:hypothetical protein